MAKRKSVVYLPSTTSSIPRVRTYHTRKPSRFVHALSARPLKVQGGRGYSKCADGMESTFFIFDVCCTPTLSCRGRRYPVPATPTHTLRVCVNSLDDPHGRGEHCSPAKRTLKEKYPLTPARSCRSTSCISCRCRRGKGHFCQFSRILP